MDGGRLNQGLQPAIHSGVRQEPLEQPVNLSHPQPAPMGNARASGASVSPLAASAASPPAAQSAPATPVPQIPRHRLGGPTAPSVALLNALAESPFSMPRRAELHEAQHPAAQLERSDEATVFIEASVVALTGDAACAFLSLPSNVTTLAELRLRDGRDADLHNIAQVLRSALHSPSSLGAQAASRTDFRLVLDKYDGAELSAVGFHALAGLRLSGITLNDLPIGRDIAERLSMGMTSLSIKLASRVDGQSDIDAISQIPTLRSLDVGRHPVSSAALAAFAAHPSLTELHFARLSGKMLCQLLENPKLQSLSIGAILGDEIEAYAALAQHRTLTSLRIGHVSKPEHLVTLSHNKSLISLDLDLQPAAQIGMRVLAAMPTLTTLSLSVSGADTPLTVADVAQLCAKPYAALRLTMVEIEPAALLHIVATQTQSLVLDYCFYITDQAVNVLTNNPTITTLSVIGCVNEPQAFALGDMPRLQKLTVDFASDAEMPTEARFIRAWLAAGKSLENLGLTVLADEGDDDETAFN